MTLVLHLVFVSVVTSCKNSFSLAPFSPGNKLQWKLCKYINSFDCTENLIVLFQNIGIFIVWFHWHVINFTSKQKKGDWRNAFLTLLPSSFVRWPLVLGVIPKSAWLNQCSTFSARCLVALKISFSDNSSFKIGQNIHSERSGWRRWGNSLVVKYILCF